MEETNQFEGKYVIAPDVLFEIVKKEISSIPTVQYKDSDMTIRLAHKGIKVNLINNCAIVDIHLCIEYGLNIPYASRIIQEKIKQVLYAMTEIETSSVNIYIDYIDFPKQ